MISILNVPVISDGQTEVLGTQPSGGDIEGGLITISPGFGFGVKYPTVSFNFDHRINRLPGLTICQGGCYKDLDVAPLYPIPCLGARFLV